MDNKPKLYDMDCEYSESLKLTFTSLCKEIIEDCYDDSQSETEESVRKKIINSRQTGLADRLFKKLNFDIYDVFKGKASKEKFNAFKLIKFLYLIEHKGFKFKEKTYEKIAIIDLLSKPRLENVSTIFSDNDQYGYTFNYLNDAIEKRVKNYEERCYIIDLISHKWEVFITKIADFFASDFALFRLDKSIKMLDSLCCFIETEIMPVFSKIILIRDGQDGVFERFYDILLCYYFRCNDEDRVLNEWPLPNIRPSFKYICEFRKYDDVHITWDIVSCAKNILNGKETDNPLAYKLLELVFYDEQTYSKRNCLYALDRAKIYWEYVIKFKDDAKNDDDLIMGILVSIVQEILCIRKQKPQIINSYYSYKNAQKSLLRIFSSETNEEDISNDNAISAQVLIKRLENRVSINTGGRELVSRVRKLEKLIYKIKLQLFSYGNIKGISKIHNEIYEDIIFQTKALFKLYFKK